MGEKLENMEFLQDAEKKRTNFAENHHKNDCNISFSTKYKEFSRRDFEGFLFTEAAIITKISEILMIWQVIAEFEQET